MNIALTLVLNALECGLARASVPKCERFLGVQNYLFIGDENGVRRHTSAHRFNSGSDDVRWQDVLTVGNCSRYFIVRLRAQMIIFGICEIEMMKTCKTV